MRKKYLLFYIVLFSFIQSQAQFQKKSAYTGSFFGKRLDSYNTNSFHPSFSIGLSAHSTLGVFGDFTNYGTSHVPFYQPYTESRGAGIQYEYARYFGKSKKWGWYANASLGLYRIRVYDKQNGFPLAIDKYNQVALSITPGIFFKASPRVTFFANLSGLSFTKSHYDRYFNAQFDMARQINIGVIIKLGKHIK